MKFFVERVGVLAPGLPGWEASRATLAGSAPYVATEFSPPAPELLPSVERRRTGLPVKLAIATGQDALAGSEWSAAELATVFAASGGDGAVIHEICETLASEDRQVSPTRFHNSVQNAPAGYWSIATQSREPSTSLCALDWSFAAGLLEAGVQVAIEHQAVLLIAGDLPYPEPLKSARPIGSAFASALLLTRERSPHSIAAIDAAIGANGAEPTRMREPGLERLRLDNPSARALPLLHALAAQGPARVVLEYVAGTVLEIDVSPC